MGVQALELRQQRRMNVEHAAAPAPHKVRSQKPHEASEAEEIDPVRVKLRIERPLEGCAIFPERSVIDDAVGMPASRARASPAASGLFDMTSTIAAG